MAELPHIVQFLQSFGFIVLGLWVFGLVVALALTKLCLRYNFRIVDLCASQSADKVWARTSEIR